MPGKPRGKGRPFQKGQSGNPGGKPKSADTVEARKVVADVKALAREYTAEAIDTLRNVMRDAKAPPAARIGAASTLLDRGHGKPPQTIDANVNFLDRLSEAEQRALLAALSAIPADEESAGEGDRGTAH